jgi:hypothetical protein
VRGPHLAEGLRDRAAEDADVVDALRLLAAVVLDVGRDQRLRVHVLPAGVGLQQAPARLGRVLVLGAGQEGALGEDAALVLDLGAPLRDAPGLAARDVEEARGELDAEEAEQRGERERADPSLAASVEHGSRGDASPLCRRGQ